MERRIINPSTWQDQFGFAQAIEASGARRILFCTGQTSTDPTGAPAHAGDMAAQVDMALDNLETLLGQAGFTLADVVRLKIFTTDMDTFLAVFPAFKARLDKAQCRCAQTLIGVVRLAAPTLLVEIEATAAQ
jgi:enamine deaminase RidA (YjgF/YER057c/UK114 family)